MEQIAPVSAYVVSTPDNPVIGDPPTNAVLISIIHENRAINQYVIFGSEEASRHQVECWIKRIDILTAHRKAPDRHSLQTFIFSPDLAVNTFIIIEDVGVFDMTTLAFTRNQDK